MNLRPKMLLVFAAAVDTDKHEETSLPRNFLEHFCSPPWWIFCLNGAKLQRPRQPPLLYRWDNFASNRIQ